MGIFGALGGSIAGGALGGLINKKLSSRKDGGQTKYGKYLESDIGSKLNFKTVGALAGKAAGALLPFQKGGMVGAPMIKLPQPKVGYRMSQGIDPRTY